jgi:hypothetical protein
VKRALLLAVATALLAAGCNGGNDEATSTNTTTTTAETSAIRVYLINADTKVWPVRRDVAEATPAAALDALLAGPTETEVKGPGLGTVVHPGTEVRSLDVADGVAHVELSRTLSAPALAQLVYTLTQFSTVDSVEIQGKTYTPAAFEDLTPLILVESPLPYEIVTSPLRVTGTANTYEATFNYELIDPAGKIVGKNFVTATSGTGTRGTFVFTVPFEIAKNGLGKLVVFELSAKDGSRINEVAIPLAMEK